MYVHVRAPHSVAAMQAATVPTPRQARVIRMAHSSSDDGVGCLGAVVLWLMGVAAVLAVFAGGIYMLVRFVKWAWTN